MAKFNITKKVDLAYLGGAWTGCYLEFTAVTFGEARRYTKSDFKSNTDKALDETLVLLEDHFISGKAVDDSNKVIEVTKDDLKDFPAEIIVKTINVLIGDIGKNV